MKFRDAVSWEELKDETIVDCHFRNEHYPTKSPYQVQTLKTASGREFVITQCLGEVQLSEVKENLSGL